MNLIALTGALLTASASVTTGSLKMDHHQNKMMDVVEKYEVGSFPMETMKLYHFNIESGFDFSSINHYLSFQVIAVNISYFYSNNNLDFYLDDLVLGDSLLEENNFYLDFYLSNSDFSINIFVPSYLEDSYLSNIVVVSLNADFHFEFDGLYVYGDSQSLEELDIVSISTYNELVPSNEHRGNLYTTIYDFFYGIFDTSDTNELSMTIMGQEMNLTSWLAHTVTIVLLLLGVLWLILVIRWLFRVFSGLVKI